MSPFAIFGVGLGITVLGTALSFARTLRTEDMWETGIQLWITVSLPFVGMGVSALIAISVAVGQASCQ